MQDTLSDAYALDGPEACKTLYRAWAATYDSDFAQARDYLLPMAVAQAAMQARPAPRRVLDVGAGTGLVAQALRVCGCAAPIDAVDLSPEMLQAAAAKQVYDTLIAADVTRPMPGPARYDLIVSAGTFTLGHVGPEGLLALRSVCLPGAVMIVSINEKVWHAKGFDAVLADRTRFADVTSERAAIYGRAARQSDPDHADDIALIARITLP